MTRSAAQLDAEIAEALNQPAWLLSRAKQRVDPKSFRDLIQKAVKFPEFKSPSKYTWDLIRDVPIHELDPGSKFDYETDPESEDEEADENLARCASLPSREETLAHRRESGRRRHRRPPSAGRALRS